MWADDAVGKKDTESYRIPSASSGGLTRSR
jgi:hypothetical protein